MTSRIFAHLVGLDIPKISYREQGFWFFLITDIMICLGVFAGTFLMIFPIESIKTGELYFGSDGLDNTLNSLLLPSAMYVMLVRMLMELLKKIIHEIKSGDKFTDRSMLVLKGFLAFNFGILVFASSLYPFLSGVQADPPYVPLKKENAKQVYNLVSRFHIAHSYGLFRVMTGVGGRPELIIEGSYDSREWLPYEFPYKPGNVSAVPQWCMPDQPRLDWQMWFAALSNINHQPWLIHMVAKLFRNSPAINTLLKINPFEGKAPPNYIRINQYKYRFTNITSDPKAYWKREFHQVYLEAIHRSEPGLHNYLRNDGFEPYNAKDLPVNPLNQIPVWKIVATVFIVNFLKNILAKQ
eukprot:TRINITY_DN9897_c0_g1_i1.p1 TRINITY_DN9897_c0_g1~~TRINITY_DN9897_c0_g1_i1.p1  ORF type:complete len:353 (+),score=37.27 TRINITY_DN9897_c0_g1_i1:821-1879(+)